MFIKIYTQINISIYSSFIYHLSVSDDKTGQPSKKCHEIRGYLLQRGDMRYKKYINITILTTNTIVNAGIFFLYAPEHNFQTVNRIILSIMMYI